MTNPDVHTHSSQNPKETLIVGISGPSSSGKTTLARLLQRIFCGVRGESGGLTVKSFIIHEDDFYFSDDRIPYTTTPSGTLVQNWDTASAIDIPFLAQSLAYVRSNGHLPPRLRSKEDLNEATDSGVGDDVVESLRGVVEEELGRVEIEAPAMDSTSSFGGQAQRTIAFMEGFLLYSPPSSTPETETGNASASANASGNGKSHSHSQEQAPRTSQTEQNTDNEKEHSLRPVHAQIHLSLFLPASYQTVKTRREGRSGYVTLGPAPHTNANTNTSNNEAADEKKKNKGEDGIDLAGEEDDHTPQNFWVDPPGYVDDVVWPRYVEDHAWLLVADGDEGRGRSLVERVGDGTRVRGDVGVRVAPGRGKARMEEVVRWAVHEVLSVL